LLALFAVGMLVIFVLPFVISEVKMLGYKIKRACEDTLRRNKKVIDYGICYRNQGCTIVELDIN
jgi:hypothetical protein